LGEAGPSVSSDGNWTPLIPGAKERLFELRGNNNIPALNGNVKLIWKLQDGLKSGSYFLRERSFFTSKVTYMLPIKKKELRQKP
jgi:hypothetical protein